MIPAICAIAAAYQIAAILACLKHLATPAPPAPGILPGISVLKPLRGVPPGFDQVLRSHAEQDYPSFELLLGYRDPRESAIPETPATRQIACPQNEPNGKVGVLIGLADQARNPILVVNDADILVPQGYLRQVTAPLADPRIGLVTCLYRAESDTWPGRWEALGVATDFAPSALVAPLVGVSEFGFGSTLAFRRADLDAIGGFAAVADYLADDYQLGARIHKLGRRNLISRVVVRTHLNAATWRAVWRHQLRWARTVRLSKPGGYLGLPVTFASFWALIAACSGHYWIAGGLLAVRLVMAVTAGWFVLRAPDVLKGCWAIPFRDLYGVAVWAGGLLGNTVDWGGDRLRIDPQGRILR